MSKFNSMVAYVDIHNQVKVTFYDKFLNVLSDSFSDGCFLELDNGTVVDIPYDSISQSIGQTQPIVEIDRNYLLESIQRARRTAIDYALNNEFNYFFTQTFDKRKIDRDNAQLLYNRLKRSLNNYKQRYDKQFRYVIFAEIHPTDTERHIHFHGLIYISPDNVDTIVRKYDKRKKCHYYQSQYFFKFGATRFDKINTNAFYTACYCSKYITKDTTRIFPSSYICSKGLKKSKLLCELSGRDIVFPRLKLQYLDVVHKYTNAFVEQYTLDLTLFQILFPDMEVSQI